MDLVVDKLKEVLASVLPVILMVIFLSYFFVDVSGEMLARFFIGAFLLILGLTIFLLGIDIGMAPIGEAMGKAVAHADTRLYLIGLSFLIGFSVTVAEPDLLILGQQVSEAMGGLIAPMVIVVVVSIGVGFLIVFGVLRILASFPMKYFFAIFYGLILLLSIFVSMDFVAISFDASGATTGALTTPFILALSASVSARKGGKSSEKDSFGLVGTMSIGPIVAVLLLSMVMGARFEGQASEYVYTSGIVAPFVEAIGHTILESLMALAPLIVIFVVMNYWYFKLPAREVSDIFKGITYTLIGLVLFLIGVNQGFMGDGFSVLTWHNPIKPSCQLSALS